MSLLSSIIDAEEKKMDRGLESYIDAVTALMIDGASLHEALKEVAADNNLDQTQVEELEDLVAAQLQRKGGPQEELSSHLDHIALEAVKEELV
jgi:hypothetical protein